MAVVQNSYSENIRPAVAGMVANQRNWDADTLNVETAAGIPFGVAVGRGAAVDGAILGAAGGDGFRGISIRDVTLDPRDKDAYQKEANIGVLTNGDIWVTTGGPVTAGQPVTFDKATGVLSNIAPSATQFVAMGATWMTNAPAGGLAIVRLSGAVAAPASQPGG